MVEHKGEWNAHGLYNDLNTVEGNRCVADKLSIFFIAHSLQLLYYCAISLILSVSDISVYVTTAVAIQNAIM